MRYLFNLFSALALVLSTGMAEEPKIYAFVVGDATPSAEWGKLLPNITLDVLAMQVMLWENVPPQQLELVSLTLERNEDAKPAAILEALDQLKPTSHDTLMVYFTGHGAVDDHGHFFSLAGGKLYREELRRRMLERKARLAVLLSDCCNVRSDGRAFMAPAPRINEPSKATPIFTSLLFTPQGVVDINGSSPGESAFFTSEAMRREELPGSLFTKAMAKYVRANQQRSPGWNDLLVDVSINVHMAFRANYPQGAKVAKGSVVQKDQTVYAIEFPNMPEKQGPRTGVKVRDQQGEGAWIVAVDDNSPAARVFDLTARKYVSLQPGQLIVATNGHTVTDALGFSTIVKTSPQILRFTLKDARGSGEYLMRLRY